MKSCYIIGAGEFNSDFFHPSAEDLVIAADGGYLFLEKMGIEPDLLIGDFDSMEGNRDWSGKGFQVMELPEKKDDTDILAAIREGMGRGCEEFHIFGGTGGRIDHTIANLQCLSFLSKRGCRGFLYGMDSLMLAVTDGRVDFPKDRKGIVAVFSFGDRAEGVTLKGLKYELADAVLTNDYPIGVSNEFIGRESSISVRRGTLLLVCYL